MKQYTYCLFPKLIVIAGYALMVLAVVLFLIDFNSGKSDDRMADFMSSAVFVFIGLILVAFRSTISIDTRSGIVIKDSGLLGINMSREKIKIPQNCDKIFIREKNKTGTGYYRLVLPINYRFKSFDMFFHSGKGMVRLINTDCTRAIKIAEFFKSAMNLDYTLELLLDKNE